VSPTRFTSAYTGVFPAAVLRIHDSFVWIRILISGSLSLTNGSGFFYFHH
jgi:hypothetical protein